MLRSSVWRGVVLLHGMCYGHPGKLFGVRLSEVGLVAVVGDPSEDLSDAEDEYFVPSTIPVENNNMCDANPPFALALLVRGFATMEPPLTADQSGPAMTATTENTSNQSYAEKLKTNTVPRDLATRSAKKAFVEGVDSKVIGTSAVYNGRKTIFLSKEEDDYMAVPFQYSLVGKFPHGYPTMTRLRAKFAALGLNKQTWYFDGFPMRVLKWTSDFDPNEESPIMPIWIKVFGLRPHWFHRQFLYHVASLIGKPLKLDEATTEIENPVVARICVEINVLERLQTDIPIQIDGKTNFFKVQYEGILEYCKIFRHQGHSIAACYLNKENQENQEKEINRGEDLRVCLEKKRGKLPIIETSDDNTDVNITQLQGHAECSNLMEKEPSNIQVKAILQRPLQGHVGMSKDHQISGQELIRSDQNFNQNNQESNEKEGSGRLLDNVQQESNIRVQQRKELHCEGNYMHGNNQELLQPITKNQEDREVLSIINNSKRLIKDSKKKIFGGQDSVNLMEDRQIMLLGTEALAPNIGVGNVEIQFEDSGEGATDLDEHEKSEECWHEVVSKKHRRSISLGEELVSNIFVLAASGSTAGNFVLTMDIDLADISVYMASGGRERGRGGGRGQDRRRGLRRNVNNKNENQEKVFVEHPAGQAPNMNRDAQNVGAPATQADIA
ncbi:hypothetical protein BUALT_Bualt05G0106100 [Buddleja alternifolia]|uniref:DUF4283 domain-containing protein n=1 Tax=Buddleja alternifolia TaxID=168488 RepID=A0AAV6XQZ4_9LAMI|nr:hypothetical protein BUALT_Bualt05G0106100 [Buddleja alternifolia]